MLLASGVELNDAVATLARLEAVPGRMQRFGGGRRPLVVVDYAHTPDALENVLRTLRELTDGRHCGACSAAAATATAASAR